MPANIPSYQMYLATTFEVIGWWGVATMLESGEEREATMTMNEAIDLSA
jgi:hypothetical protein